MRYVLRTIVALFGGVLGYLLAWPTRIDPASATCLAMGCRS